MALSKARQDKYKEAREKLGAGKAGESRDTDSSRTSRPSEETSGKALSAERRAKYEEARNRAYMVDAANNALRTGRPRQTEPAKSSGSTDGHADTRQERSSFAGDGESRARKGRLAWMDEAGSIPGTQSPGLFDVGTGAIMDREQMNKARLNSLDRRRAAVAAETEEDEDAILRLAREDPAAAREQIAGRVAKSVERDELFNEIYPNSGVLSTLEGMGEGVNIGMTKQFPASMAGLATGVHEGLGTFWNMINTPGGQKYADYESPLREKALDMQEKAALASEENLAGRGPAGTRFVSTAQAAGNMIPGAVLGGVGGVLSGGALAELGTAAISAGAAGSSYLDAISQGAGVGEAAAYGLLSGATEYYTERLFGGNPLVDKRPGLVNQVVKKLGGSQKLLAFLASQPVETMNEGLEEAISEVLSPVWQRLTYDPDADFATLDQIMDSAIDGVLLAGFMQGGEAVIRRTANAVRGRGAQGDDNPSAASRQLPLHRGANGVRGGVETATPQIAAISAEMAGEAAIPQSAELTAPFTQGSQGKARETWGDNPSVSAYAEPAPLAQGSLRGRGEPMGRGDYDGDALRAREVQLKADALQAAKQTMGERGYATFEQAMRDDQDPAKYYRDMVRAYNEGISGLASTGSETLTEVQYSEMYAAGRDDAAASLRREQKAAGYASVAGADSGLVYDEFVQEAVKSGRTLQDEQGHAILDTNGESRVYLTAETADKINSIAKELGVRVQFVDSIRGGEANAAIIDSTVLIQRNNENPVAFLIGHEMTHRIQQLAPKEYRAFREIVAAERFDQIQAHIDSYARQNEILTYEEALDEAAADYAGQLVDSGEALDAFIRRHREDRTLLQRVRDAIRALIDKLRGAEKRKAQTAAGKLEAALQAATEQAKTLQAQSDDGTMAAKYSLNGKYWRPNLSREEWELLNRRIDAEINDSAHALDASTQWAYANEKGNQVFAIYGIGDGTEATPLYASGGKTAATDYQAFMKAGKEFDYGTDRDAKALNRVFKTLRREQRQSNGNLSDAQRGIAATGHERVSAVQGESNGRGSNGNGQQTGGKVNTRFSLEAPVEETDKLEANKNTAQTDGAVRYSINARFGRDLQEWFKDGRPAGERFVLGSTGPVLQGLGAIESDIYMNGDKINLILKQHPEMTLREIQKIPELLEDPTLILKSKGVGKKGNNSRMVLYGSIKAQNGQPVLAVLDLRPSENGFTLDDMQKVNSAYTKDSPAGFITSSEILYADEKRTVPLLRQFGLTIASRQLLRNGSMGSIFYDGNIVKMSGVPFSSVVGQQEKTRYSLKNVPPVEPTSDEWKPGATFDEVKATHPTLFALDADEADTRNPTQITGTVKSYRKIYDALQAENFDGAILDASSGLGYGTRAGREEYGFDVDDIEPFPDAKYKPNYTDYSALDKTYDVIISNAVLNVMPQDLRDAMVVKIGEMLNPGGRAFINVRGTDVKNAGSKVAINDDLMEYFISNTGSYQKGFTSKELVSYLKDALGDGFTVEPTRKFGAVSAIVTRDGLSMTASAEQANKNTAQTDGAARYSLKHVNGKNVVWIDESSLTNKELNNHKAVAEFIAQHIGEVYTIIESGQRVYIGKDLPGEYTHSAYTDSLRKRNPRALKAKNKAASELGLLIETATNRRWEKTRHPHSKDAKYGMYRYDASIAFPVKAVDGTAVDVRAYDAELLIRNASDGKKYLYDVVNVKRNTADAIDLQQRETRLAAYKDAASHGDVSTDSVRDTIGNVNGKFSLKAGTESKSAAALQEENRLLREQMKDYIAIQRQNAKLRESRDYWQGQTRKTQRATADKKAVAEAAKRLIRSYGTDIDAENIQSKLQSLSDYVVSGYDGKDELTYTEVFRRAESIARELVENAVDEDTGMYDTYSDLRDYLRTTKIIFGKEYHGDIADYGDFRKRQFGRLKLSSEGGTNIDQVYLELCERWPELFDEQEQSNPADQLLHIVEVLDAVSQTDEYNPFSHYMEQAVAGAANEVIETVLDLPQTRKTFADRQALKLDAAKAADRQRLQKAREQNAARLAELRKQNRQRVQNIVAKAQETRARQIDALKERHKARDAAARESRNAREVRAKIIRHAKKLSQKLLRPSDKQHIPEQLRTAVSAVLESINLESQYTIDENGKRVKNGGGSPTKRTEAFIALKEQYAKIRAEGGDLVIDPSLFGSEADMIQGGFDAVIAMQNVKLADMSPEQLETVWQVVKAVEHSVRTAGRLLSQSKYETTAQMADSFKTDVMTRRRKLGGNRSISLETPYTFFAHFGKTGMEIYRMLRNAQDRQELMARDVAERVQSVLGEKASAKGAKEFVSAIRGSKVWKMNAEKQSYTTSAGAKLELTTAQAMEIYLLSKREQGRQHLLKGGIYQPEIRDTVTGRVTTQRGTQSIVLNEADLDRIDASLSTEAKRIADGLQELTAGTLAEYGNEASMRAYGYRKFREKFYWPIKSARESLHSNQSKSAENVRDIKNIGMAQQLNPDAATPLEIGSVFDTFANHASDMIDYAAWLNTIEDVNRLFNFKYRDQLGNKTGQNFKGLMDEKGGKGSQDYLMKLLGDIQNGIGTRDFEPFTAKAARYVGKFKGAAVGANIRVIIQQPTAFFRASVVLSPADMLKGMTGGVTEGSGWEKALAHSATAMRKEVGSFDISSPYTMSERFYGKEGAANKLNELAGAGAGKADEVTWGKLWNACEWQVNRERPGLRPGSEAFYSAVDEVFTDMIDQTQVVDGVLQRSNIMRGKSALSQQATAFMGEPIMSLNVFIRAYDKLRYETEPQKRSAAIKNLGRAAAALVVTNVVNAVAQSLIDAMRDDDGDKKYWERFWEAFTGLSGEEESAWEKVWTGILNGNVGSNMNPLGQIPFVKDGLSLFQGYSVGRTDMEVFSDVIDAAKLFVKSADGGSKTTAYAVKCLLASAAKLEGLPVSNLTRDVWALIRTVAVETDNIPLQYEMEKAIYNISNTGNKNRYYTILYRALEQGDMDSFRHIREELINSMGIDGASIDSAMRSRYATTREKDPDYALSQRARDLIGSRDKLAPDKEKAESFGADDLDSGAYDAYSEQRADDYRSMADALALDPDFNSMDDETRDKVLDNAYELADKGALAAQSGGRYEVSNGWIRSAVEAEREYGIKPEVYVMLKAQADAAESLRDENGSAIANSKSLLIMQAVYNTSGLTERQRSALFEYLGVGKTVLHYNRARVNEKLAEMGALAG